MHAVKDHKCRCCGKSFVGNESNHLEQCESFKRLKCAAKKTPSLIRKMDESEFLAIEKSQAGRHCKAGVSGSYFYWGVAQ